MNDENQAAQPELAPHKPRVRLPHKPTLRSALVVLGHALGTEFNPPADESEAIRRRIVNGVNAALRATEFDLEVAINIVRDWQRPLGQYYHWPDFEPLRRKLQELGDDVVALTPVYAHSVAARLRSGRTILINRDGPGSPVMTQTNVAICARASAPPEYPVVLAFRFKSRREYQLAWGCPFCRAPGHRHERCGVQRSVHAEKERTT